MSVSDRERAQLRNWFEERMGSELGDALMRSLPPTGWGDIATRRDLQILEDKLDHKLDTLAMAMKADLAELRGEIAESHTRLVGWIFAAQATVVAAIGLLLGFLR